MSSNSGENAESSGGGKGIFIALIPWVVDPGVSTAGCTTATLHSTTAVERDIIYVSGPLTAGSHIVQLTSPGRSPIALDGFVVLG